MIDFNDLDFVVDCELKYNPEILGQTLDKKAGSFGVLNFENFLKNRNKIIIPPNKPNKPLANSNNQLQAMVFSETYRQAMIIYNKKYKHYESILQEQKLLQQYQEIPSGYAQFLTENYQVFTPFLESKNIIPISEENRQLHTYITGGTGSGKSETIKSFIWHYLTKNKSTGLVLLTPNGEIAEQVAKFWVNIENNRLVYIEPSLDFVHFPCLNPFDVPNKQDLSDIEAEKYAEAFRSVFEEILGKEFTSQMNALLISTLPVIVKMPNSSIYDFIDFLEPRDDKAGHSEKVLKYIKFANNHLRNKGILDFLNGQFLYDDSYNRTKLGIHTRLRALFNTTIMQAVMVGKSTLNIEQMIDQRKLLIFNFPKGKMPLEYRILGLFILSTIKIISFRRDGRTNFTPCHLFIDEFQNYITPSLQEILEESRKFGLFLTLAQQQAGARMDKALFTSILGNTAVKLTGVNGIDTLKILAQETGDNVENMQKNLSIGRFALWQKAKIGDTQKPPIIVTMPRNTLKDKQSMTKEQWETLKNTQIQAFYRPVGQNTQTEEKTQNSTVFDEFDTYFK